VDKATFDYLPWEEIKEISKTGIFEQVFKKIPKARLRFVAQEENREILIKSALRSLQKNNPDARHVQATELADLMQEFARKMLEGQNV
jgi:hypothetical protein